MSSCTRQRIRAEDLALSCFAPPLYEVVMAQDSVLVQILGEKLDGKDGDKDVADLVGEGCVIGLYFSAHWCPPCRTFTPQLAKWYNTFKVTANADKFEIVFVSSDRDEEGFDEYYGEMPWLALPFGDRDRKVSSLQR